MIDKIAAIILLILLLPLLFLTSLIILIFDGLPVFFTQKRIGKNNIEFKFYKFRTMKNNIGDIPTHKLHDSSLYLTFSGSFLRKFSIDELPQLVNIIKGDMLFIGPRPALFNQNDLISKRTKLKIHKVKPGVTGWAQVNGRDTLSIPEKVKLDYFYVKKILKIKY